MPTTAVSICSNALLMLGAKTISSFDEATGSIDGGLNRAQLCANLYPSVRDALLRAHPWNCAVKRVVLSPLSEAPAFDYSYAFQLPGDWLRTIQVGDFGEELDYVSESRTILANATTLKLRYIFRNDNEATWDQALVRLAELAMAATLAYPVTQSASMKESHAADFERALRLAKAVDGQDDPPQTLGDTPLLNARFSGSSRVRGY